ncbi:MAG: REP element-mobilizing transposase RayT, partial [Cognaticolwellia sp.]
QLEVEILKGVVSKDHVHLLVSAPPTVSASNIMKRVKGRSSTKLFQEYPPIEKAILGSTFLGTRLFLCNGRGVNRSDDQRILGASLSA